MIRAYSPFVSLLFTGILALDPLCFHAPAVPIGRPAPVESTFETQAVEEPLEWVQRLIAPTRHSWEMRQLPVDATAVPLTDLNDPDVKRLHENLRNRLTPGQLSSWAIDQICRWRSDSNRFQSLAQLMQVAALSARRVKMLRPLFMPLWPPLETPVIVLGSIHGDSEAKAGEVPDLAWLAGQIKVAGESVEPGRPIILWLEHVLPLGMPKHFRDLAIQSAPRGVAPEQAELAWVRALTAPVIDREVLGYIQSRWRESFALTHGGPALEALFRASDDSPYFQTILDAIQEVRGAGHSVTLEIERVDRDAVLNYYLSEVLPEAIRLFVAEGELDRALAMADRLLDAWTGLAGRDRSFVRQIANLHNLVTEALHIVPRGAGHGPFMSKHLDRARLRSDVRTGPSDQSDQFGFIDRIRKRFYDAGIPSASSSLSRRLVRQLVLGLALQQHIQEHSIAPRASAEDIFRLLEPMNLRMLNQAIAFLRLEPGNKSFGKRLFGWLVARSNKPHQGGDANLRERSRLFAAA